MRAILIHVIQNREFELFYQPQYTLIDKKLHLSGAEALLRLKSEDMCTTKEFIEFAEEKGYIIQIGEIILEDGLKTLHEWNSKDSTKKLSLSLNISPIQIQSDNFFSFLENKLNQFSFDRDKLKLEIKEGIIENKEDFIKRLLKIKEYGIKISLDSFGTEYSSLSSLLMFPISEIKIERLFVSSEKYSFVNSDISMKVITSIRDIAKLTDSTIVAEGIETIEQLRKLSNIGIYKFQGYLFSKAVPSVDFEKIIIQDKEEKNISFSPTKK